MNFIFSVEITVVAGSGKIRRYAELSVGEVRSGAANDNSRTQFKRSWQQVSGEISASRTTPYFISRHDDSRIILDYYHYIIRYVTSRNNARMNDRGRSGRERKRNKKRELPITRQPRHFSYVNSNAERSFLRSTEGRSVFPDLERWFHSHKILSILPAR